MPRPTSSFRYALAAAIALLGSLTMLAPAGAGVPGPRVDLFPAFVLDQPVFTFEVPGGECAADTVVTIDGIPDATVDLTDPNNGTITVPVGTPGGSYDLTLTCNNVAGAPITMTNFLEFHRVTIEKVVTGDAPADAQFAIDITCSQDVRARGDYALPEGTEADGDPFMNADLTFGVAGGSTTLVGYQAQGCTVSETDDGGATTSSIVTEDCDLGPIDGGEAAGASGTFDVFSPIDCTQTVTNDFEAAPAAAVVQIQPAFTG